MDMINPSGKVPFFICDMRIMLNKQIMLPLSLRETPNNCREIFIDQGALEYLSCTHARFKVNLWHTLARDEITGSPEVTDASRDTIYHSKANPNIKL